MLFLLRGRNKKEKEKKQTYVSFLSLLTLLAVFLVQRACLTHLLQEKPKAPKNAIFLPFLFKRKEEKELCANTKEE